MVNNRKLYIVVIVYPIRDKMEHTIENLRKLADFYALKVTGGTPFILNQNEESGIAELGIVESYEKGLKWQSEWEETAERWFGIPDGLNEDLHYSTQLKELRGLFHRCGVDYAFTGKNGQEYTTLFDLKKFNDLYDQKVLGDVDSETETQEEVTEADSSELDDSIATRTSRTRDKSTRTRDKNAGIYGTNKPDDQSMRMLMVMEGRQDMEMEDSMEMEDREVA